MILNFIEIGTADFNTIIQECDDNTKGISIEPIKKYLDNLPNKKNVKKINCAVVDNYDISSINVFYVEESIIEQHRLGHWLKGCNSVSKPHDFHTKYYPDPGEWHRTLNRENLPKRNLLEEGLVTCIEIPCYTFEKIMEDNNVEYVEFIKIDTEGQDSKLVHSILDYYEKSGKELPKKILFESNAHNDPNDVNKACKRLAEKGYSMNGWNGETYDTVNLHDCIATR